MTSSKSKNVSKIKIIAGQWGGRFIHFPAQLPIRPTPNRIRETLFNWLMPHIENASCLDAFSGSGALSFEALSRGAKHVLGFEKNKEVFNALQDNKIRLNIENFEVIQQDFFRWCPPNIHFNLIFLDPPFHQNILLNALEKLLMDQLLAPNAYIYFEAEKKFDSNQITSNFKIIKNKTAGQVQYGLLQLKQE